jgi:hypothetical protein
MMALLDADRLTISATVTECAALWSQDARVFLNVWHPTELQVYIDRWCRLPGDVPLCSHLDFTDRAGRSWIAVYDWSSPPHPQCTHPDVLDNWEAALARHQLTWWSSLDDPRFAWLHANNPVLLR